MPPTPGTRIGPYEIVAPLGAGGMGEVYRARDTRLGREVALKILPPAFAYDPARRARFEQEARAAAALNHPNIVGVHDLGEIDGAYYLVSELVPGETLDTVLARGPMPVKKLLDIAAQMADGMAAAHAARITHRDLKPQNIMITPEGRVKILDFGLAKQAPAIAASGANADATMTVHQTEAGVILGTVHYMSPEQARGAPADYRSDQFSFGLILYEMASGRRAFEKPATVQTMAAILSEEAPPIERDIPAPLRWTIERCLAKEPTDRYESTRDLFYELRRLKDYLSQASSMSTVVLPPAAAPAKARRAPRWLWPAVAVLGVVGAFATAPFLTDSDVPDQSNYRFTPFAFDPGGQTTGIWSPDGKAVAYEVGILTPLPNQIWVRYLDSPTPVQITKLKESAHPVAWSPDSRRIIFVRGGEQEGLWSVSVAGGEPQPFLVQKVDSPQAVAVAPDLKTVAVIKRGDDHLYSVFVSSPPGSEFKRYQPDPIASHALYNNKFMRFSPDGKKLLVLFRGDRGSDEAWVMPFPMGGKKPRRVFANLKFYGGTPFASWMPDNRHVVLAFQGSNPTAHIWMADTESGHAHALTSGTASHQFLDVSPDGSKIVFTEAGGNYDIASVDVETGKAQRWMATERDEYMAAWSAKQQRMVYVTTRNGPQEIWIQGRTGTARPLVTAKDFPPGTTQWFIAPDLSPDGDRVMYTRMELQGGSHIWISNVSGGAPVPLTNDTEASEFAPSFSPDGASATYMAIHHGKFDLMKVQTTGEAAPTVVKADTSSQGEVPAWSPTGEWILFGNRLYSPDGQKERDLGKHGSPNYAFSQDGKRLYGIKVEEGHTSLISLDVATGAEKKIAELDAEFQPSLGFHPGIRFSLAPDGKSFVYPVGTQQSNLWLFEGFR